MPWRVWRTSRQASQPSDNRRGATVTPFGQKLRTMRADRAITLKAMAGGLGVSAAYLSALEHGRRGAPTWYLVQKIITFFNVIWDEAEEIERLAQISHPRVVVDTSGLGPQATELANIFARRIGSLGEQDIRALLELLNERLRTADRPPKP